MQWLKKTCACEHGKNTLVVLSKTFEKDQKEKPLKRCYVDTVVAKF